MASIKDFSEKHDMGKIMSVVSNQTNIVNTDIARRHKLLSSPEEIFKRTIDGLNGFCSSLEENLPKRDDMNHADDYMNHVNGIFSSYSSIRKKLDGSIVFLIGDLLLECRSKFFPETDRKTRGQWSSFLKSNLCVGFEKSTAYVFMSVAEKLNSYRNQSLSISSLKNLLKLKNSGFDLGGLDPHQISNEYISNLLVNSNKYKEDSLKIEIRNYILQSKKILKNLDTIEFQKSDSDTIDNIKSKLKFFIQELKIIGTLSAQK